MEFVHSSSSSTNEISEDLVFALKNLYPSAHYRTFLKNLVRPGSRKINEYREIKMTSGLYSQSQNTYGSSLIQLGESKAACGITIMIGTPSASTPKQGDIDFDVSLWSICSPKYAQQRSKQDCAYNIESMLSSLVTDGRLIDLEQLCIEEGKSAFRLCVSITYLSDAGNLFDLAVLALIAALKDVKLPNTVIVGTDVCVEAERLNKLILLRNPISITCGVFDDIFIVDPDEQEQLIMRGTVTCVIDENNNICTLSQRVSEKGLSFQQLQEVTLLSIKKSIEIRKQLSW